MDRIIVGIAGSRVDDQNEERGAARQMLSSALCHTKEPGQPNEAS